MPIALLALAMSSSFFNPSFAFSSHFDPDGAPLSELSWSSSLAVVAVSFSGIFAVIILMLACLCCKKGGIGFKEFENAEGDEYVAEFSEQGSPAAAAQAGPDVYVLPLTEVSLPMAKQPGRSVQLLKSTDLGRHSLLYLKEIGHGWFGKVFLGEVHSGVSGTQVVVKELKVNASVQEQMLFLEEVQPYRALQHSNLLQCLAQCAEVTPYLLVMEFCPLGDLKGYLRSCRVTESMAPDPLTLQRMACEVACGILHLHRHNYVHSDLALRNCLLTADLTVKVGDYGLSHRKYREDYLVTADQLWVPLRWIAPELVDEVHGNLLVVDQTKSSNVWSLGVTIWELFELGAQPYPQHSDRQVLAYAVREQQLKLPKPQLQLALSERWYEVMQFCWLQPEQRPTAEEVHLLLSYLCAKGTTELEEEFERRWRSLRPGGSTGLGSGSTAPAAAAAELTAASSFPLLERFTSDGFHVDSDDVLTVTETSHGLNFEYKWEAGCGAEAYPPPGAASSPGSAARLQELCAPDGSPPGVVPVLSAHSPSVGSEYFIRLEGAVPAAGHDPDCAACAPSPQAEPDQDNNSEESAVASLAMEPLLGHAPPTGGLWGPCDHHSHRRQEPPCPSRSPSPGTPMLPAEDIDWGVATFCPPFFDDPLGASPSGSPGAQSSPGDEKLEEGKAGRAAQRGHWSSNRSANNNSGSRDPESWDPGYVSSFTDSYRDDCSSLELTPRASPELGQALSQEDPRDFLPGLVAASSGQEPSLRFNPLPLRPAKGLAPVACLITSSWTEAVVGGAENPIVEPKLAQEAEGSAEPQLPLPSVPSPSHEGASLLSEEASAPDILPASPTPAAGSWVTVPKPAPTLENGCSLGPEAPSSEDEDTTEATSGVFTDLSSDGPHTEKSGIVPALRCLQKQVGTPDSLDSLDIPSSASDGGCEVLSPSAAGPPGGQPRAADSGYETENYESPEFVLKEAHESDEPEVFGEPASEGESPGPDTLLSVSLGGLSKKNPYRDSAYFSDLDAESEPTFGPEKRGEIQDPQKEQDPRSPPSPGHQSVPALPRPEGSSEVLSPPQQSEEPLPAGPRPEPLGAQGPVEVQPVPGLSHSKCFLLTSVPLSSEGNGTEAQGPPGQLSGSAQQGQMKNPNTPRSPLCLALPGHPGALEGRPEDEEDTEDSEESDEELRCYSVQEPSEDSEEEPPAVPVVVAESQSARNLRSLLKMPSLLSEAFCDDLERKKKAVSFFDDVTVYLFDQESPTRETGEPFPSTKESLPTLLEGSPGSPSATGLPLRADHSPDSSTPEPGSRFQWDGDFPLMASKAALVTALDPADPVLAAPPTPAAPFSRFTVSPTPASRFSITHVSDSDAQSVGGPAAGAGDRYTEA